MMHRLAMLLPLVLLAPGHECAPKGYVSDNARQSRKMKESNDRPPDGWQQFRACDVTFYLPHDFSETGRNAEDSCFVRYQNKNTTLDFDLMYGSSGKQSRRSEFSGKRDFLLERAVIDGQKAEVMTWYEVDVPGRLAGLNYLAVLFIPGVDDEHSELTVFTFNRNTEAQAISRKIFGSVKFISRRRA